MLKTVLRGLAALGLVVSTAHALNVTTWRYDAARTGQNTSETALTPANVNSSSFGKSYSYTVDGYVYAQPLYLANLTVNSVARNVVFIATQHDSVYAFDADHSVQLWKASLLDAAHGAASGATTVPSGDIASSDIVPEIGITGTPVIDATAGTLFVVSKTKENGAYVQRLHALDVTTGNERAGSPVTIQGSVSGTGIGSVNGTIAFQPEWELNRPGLTLANGTVFVGFGAHGDNGPYHGWLFAYNSTTLARTAIWNSSPGGKGNGLWQSGASMATDVVNGVPRLFFATGNWFSTGNGGPNPSPPYTAGQDYSNAIVRMDITNGGLTVSDEWTPFDQQTLSSTDQDQTSGGVLLLPDQSGANVHELVQVGKNGRIEVLNRDNLGGFNSSSNSQIVQEIGGKVQGLWSTPAYWNGRVYFWGNGDSLKQFSLSGGQLSTSPTATASVSSNFPGASPVVTSNGTSNGILWAIRSDAYSTGGPAVLYAFDATNVANLLYSSAQNASRDAAGKAVKFAVPLVVNGKVYVSAQGEVDVYGLLASAPPSAPPPTFTPVAGVYPSTQSVSLADSLSGASIYYTTDGSPPSTGSKLYTGPITIASTTTVQAIAVAQGYNPSSIASAAYTIGAAPVINFSSGFAGAKGLQLNGSAINTDDSRLQLTTGLANQAGSAFFTTAVNVANFTTDFTFQLSGTAPIADGITFTLQGNAPTALGPAGGGLGYGPDTPGGTGGIGKSVALKFDVYSNQGEGNDSTGVYLNGVSPTTPAVDLSSSGVSLASGDTLSAHVVYDGTYLYLTLSDPVVGKTFSTRWQVNIPQAVGGSTAYVGFTGGTGGLAASQKILTWTYTAAQSAAQPVTYQTSALSAVSSGPVFRTFTWSGFPDGVGTILDATKVGDSVTFTLNVAKAGTYDVHVTSKNFNIRGIWQLAVDGLNQGPTEDEYSPTETLTDFDVGPIVFGAAGNHTFKFTVTGKNAASTDWKISFDVIKLNPQ
ncbi:MAG: chitobiase/beta-hexosaminidase C-terminal domain-containing protein [Gammaproteobacteria bacterium]|nr:chitobiase/beta-hexosaminidase C-terminal domain-containing protein [Gammaproteobacteria bacterium]